VKHAWRSASENSFFRIRNVALTSPWTLDPHTPTSDQPNDWERAGVNPLVACWPSSLLLLFGCDKGPGRKKTEMSMAEKSMGRA